MNPFKGSNPLREQIKMRHNRDEKRFDRTYSHLKSMLSNMTNDVINMGRIKTTTQRAKVLRSKIEKMITLGKDGSLAARRRAFAFMKSKDAVTRLFGHIAPQYAERKGGYTRIMKLGVRVGDAAQMSIIELVEGKGAIEAKPKAPAKAKKAAVKPKAVAKPKAAAKPKAEAKPKEKAVAKPKVKKEKA